MAQEFYATVAQASFTLLGLWWVLLQIRYEAWFADVDYRRAVYDISLYFLLPGMMGLGALLAAQEPTIWRGVFAVLGAVGVVESALVVGGMRVLRAWPALVAVADWGSLVAYALLVAVALSPQLPRDVGLGLRPLEAEGMLVAILLMLGITLACALFVTTGPGAEPSAARRERAD
ncbi:MAG TPA: hypothetical protein VHF51_08025 [Solirubrobacteraceae bacterium]|nr:hypothetical protein [Solirubrobacteraceae bacterium]